MRKIKIYKIRATKGSEIRDFYFLNYTFKKCVRELKSLGYSVELFIQ